VQNSWSVLASGESCKLRCNESTVNAAPRGTGAQGFSQLSGQATVVARSAESVVRGIGRKLPKGAIHSREPDYCGRYAGQLLAPSRSLSTGHSILTPCQVLVKPRDCLREPSNAFLLARATVPKKQRLPRVAAKDMPPRAPSGLDRETHFMLNQGSNRRRQEFRFPDFTGGLLMRNILALLAASVLTLAGVGWYLGWYSVESTTGTAGKRQVNIEVDSRKISEDLQRGTEKIQQVIDQNKAADSTSPTDKSGTQTKLQ
jgi:hypothetical protein